jgi:beta-N-acetylhexosaminidase
MAGASLSIVPRKTPSARASERAAPAAAMTLSEQIAQMFMAPITGVALTADDAAWLRDLKPGGVILVQGNFGSPDELLALTAAIHATNPDRPPLVAIDQEGGIVSRIADDPAPDAPTLGFLTDEEVSTYARMRADILLGFGFDVNFAPVADIAFSPDSFMLGRTFGDNALRVAEVVGAYVAGVEGSGVLHCAKHFPGHGRVSLDSHELLPVLDINEGTWLAEDVLPFVAAIDNGVPMVMLGHLAAPMWDDLPATFSPRAVQVLREDLGFSGVVVTDDLLMGALSAWPPFEIVDRVIAAGVDLLLYVGLPLPLQDLINHVVQRVAEGAITEERVTESVARLTAMRAQISI